MKVLYRKLACVMTSTPLYSINLCVYLSYSFVVSNWINIPSIFTNYTVSRKKTNSNTLQDKTDKSQSNEIKVSELF